MKKERVYTSTSELPLSLSAEDVAAVLGISRSKAYDLFHSEGFPVIRLGKRMIVPREAFLSWVEGRLTSN